VPVYAFEDCRLDTDGFELRRNDERRPLEPQALELLGYLVTNPDRLITKQELLEQVWKTTFVSDSALSTRIKEVRHALGDSGAEQRVIKTVHGRGYRFVAPVTVADGSAPSPVTPSEAITQEIRFCSSADGVRIAFATTGSGPPFLKVANWLTNLEFDPVSPVWSHLVTELVPDRQFIRYDERGCGLSDWDVEEFGLEYWVQDLETIVETLGLERFPLLGMSQGGPIAISYAVRHPERVSHLILHGTYARGLALRDTRAREEVDALRTLITHGWGQAGSAYAQLFATRIIPRSTPEQIRWLIDLQRVSTTRENAARFFSAFTTMDVRGLLPRLKVPTLVLHSRGDQAAPFEEGRLLAAGIPNSRLVPLESDNHLLLRDEPAWARFKQEVQAFLGDAKAG
jgi:pimeloyl-ACP methyl ester carboxylesterase/DNA-binding winged helix-turn-helix (wHTH) protein